MSKKGWLRFTLIISILMILSFICAFFGLTKKSQTNSPQMAHQVNLPEVIQNSITSAVHIGCDQWQGSGVALTEDIIATARHVVDGVRYTITLNGGQTVQGVQAISHKDFDIGFIKVNKPILKPAKFGSIKDCVLGQSIFIVGSPYGKICFNNVTLGIISNLDPDWDFTDMWTGEKYGWKIAFLSDSAAHPGNSGGPVFTIDGKVRGLLVGGISPVLNCSMPSDLFMNDIELIKTLFGLDKYKVEKPKQVYMYGVESREDYYLND